MWILIDENQDVVELIKAPKPMTIDGVQHPRAIFEKWSAAELAAIGVYPAEYGDTPPEPPYEITGETVVFDAGQSKGLVTRTFNQLPEPFPVLSRVQLLSALEIDLGKTGADVDAAISAMPDGTTEEANAKAHARIAWKNGTRFGRDDPFVVMLIPDLGLSDTTVDPVWRAAATKY